MVKFIVILLFFSKAYSLDIFEIGSDALFDTDTVIAVDKVKGENIFKIKPIDNSGIDRILSDYDNRISEEFTIPKYFHDDIKFWFTIYSNTPSWNTVIHNKYDLGKMFFIISWDELHKRLDKWEAFLVQTEKGRQLVDLFYLHLSGKKNKLFVQYAPANQKSITLRIQTGLKDFFENGAKRSKRYKSFILDKIEQFELPKEILAIPFLESNFNHKILSKVGATGLWQFMDFIGRKYVPYDKNVNSLLNPYLSTLAGLHLNKENFHILHRWDLAITAYNAGSHHLILARRKLKKKKPTLQEVFDNYKSSSFGFAAKNFYVSFMSLVYIVNYLDELFSIDHGHLKTDKMFFYISKCRATPYKIFQIYPHLKIYNEQYINLKTELSPGQIYVSSKNLPDKHFFKLEENYLRRKYPRNWHKLFRYQSCSIK